MTDPLSIALLGASVIAALAIAAFSLLKGWRGWLDLKRLELASRGREAGMPPASGRIQLADLKERVRKLEAIAAGIDI